MANKRKLNDEQHLELYQDRVGGMTWEKLAAKFSVSHMTARKYYFEYFYGVKDGLFPDPNSKA